MKKALSILAPLSAAALAVTLLPAAAADVDLHYDFESGADGWAARGTATVEQATGSAAAGSGALSVTNRNENWSGASITLPSDIKAGETYSFSAMVTQQASPMAVTFKLSLQYSTGDNPGGMPFGGGQNTFACIAKGDAASGMWTKLENTTYTIPEGATNLVLYVETEGSSPDFLVDEIYVQPAGSTHVDPPGPGKQIPGDVNSDGKVDGKDAKELQEFLLAKSDSILSASAADLNNDNKLDGRDLSLLKQRALNPAAFTTTTATTTGTTGGSSESSTTVSTTTAITGGGNHASPKEYMAQVKSTWTNNVPSNVQSGKIGDAKHYTYHSKKANRDKGVYVWTPPGYTESEKYPVLYMNHGVMGDESSMLSGFAVLEMASNLIQSGEAVPFIIVFPQMYTDPAAERPQGFNFNMDIMDRYDDYIYDLTESLMPWVEEHFSVKTGRDNTAIAGFSMGGRESLYIGINKAEMFGYVCASSPAPGIVPASDMYISNHLGSYIPGTNQRMKPADFKISDDKLPYLLIIGGGTSDNVVGTFPKEYHQMFEQNGTEHIWQEYPGKGHDGGVGIPLFYNFFKALFKA